MKLTYGVFEFCNERASSVDNGATESTRRAPPRAASHRMRARPGGHRLRRTDEEGMARPAHGRRRRRRRRRLARLPLSTSADGIACSAASPSSVGAAGGASALGAGAAGAGVAFAAAGAAATAPEWSEAVPTGGAECSAPPSATRRARHAFFVGATKPPVAWTSMHAMRSGARRRWACGFCPAIMRL